MSKASMFKLLLTHPLEFRALAQYSLFHETTRDITSPKEYKTSGYDRESMKACWRFLDQTSRSFSAVIKELDGDLARVICLFYLVLRGLDTIEDDMTLSDDIKQPILRTFHQKLTTDGWTFDGCGPAEKDRQLLVEFDNVITELALLDPTCRHVIIDIALKMETGMADFAHRAATSPTTPYLTSIEEYDLYCHYVAGLVGEGLSRLFAATEKERAWIASQLVLSNSMGLLLQKTNILRDFREDCDEKRYFWPQEIWAAYGFTRPEEMHAPGNEERALWALSKMTLNALSHCIDALDYLVLLKNQTVFNFCAIPATMAIATLELCFMNPAVFQRNIKIRKAAAVTLIMQSTNPFTVANIFRDFARKIHRKADLKDPNYLAICVMTGKIECWVEHHYPSFVSISKESKTITLKTDDPRSEIVRRDRDLDKQRQRDALANKEQGANSELGLASWELFLLVFGAFGFVFVATALTTIGGLYYYYGNDWTWSMLGANTVGRFIEESKTTVTALLGRDKKPYA